MRTCLNWGRVSPSIFGKAHRVPLALLFLVAGGCGSAASSGEDGGIATDGGLVISDGLACVQGRCCKLEELICTGTPDDNLLCLCPETDGTDGSAQAADGGSTSLTDGGGSASDGGGASASDGGSASGSDGGGASTDATSPSNTSDSGSATTPGDGCDGSTDSCDEPDGGTVPVCEDGGLPAVDVGVPPPSCTTTCELGARRCEGSDVQQCVTETDGCRRWRHQQSCPYGCTGGGCLPPPPPACENDPGCDWAGLVRCVAGGNRQTCGNYDADSCLEWQTQFHPDCYCHDGVRDGDETDVDCGGSCGPCATGKTCTAATDCNSKLCLPPTVFGGCEWPFPVHVNMTFSGSGLMENCDPYNRENDPGYSVMITNVPTANPCAWDESVRDIFYRSGQLYAECVKKYSLSTDISRRLPIALPSDVKITGEECGWNDLDDGSVGTASTGQTILVGYTLLRPKKLVSTCGLSGTITISGPYRCVDPTQVVNGVY